MRWLYFINPVIAMWITAYIWGEILPDGKFWWSLPTYIKFYVILMILIIDEFGRFSKVQKI